MSLVATAMQTVPEVLPTLAAAADGGSGDGLSAGGGGSDLLISATPFLPFLGAIVIGVFAIVNLRSKLPAWLTVLACAGSFAAVLISYLGWDGHSVVTATAFEWISLSWGEGGGESFAGNFAFYFDGLSLLWMLFVAGLATMIALYASEYMEHDVGRDYCRFFGAFCLFVFSMSCLVMSDNLLLLFLGWEGVGLCSYLLIGYYYKKPEAVAAAKKAFVVNRIGDLGLLMGLLLTFTTFGTIEFAPLFELIEQDRTAGGAVLSETWQVWTIPLLLLAGACGKSAQLFFYVWLPDAMEGPTPVSALIHAATMVTAGVYLVARFMPLFLADPDLIALSVVTWSGTLTALWAATIAMAQYDIKRIMGYSTISQLGYMFAGLGVLSASGGVFHVFTHAFFKATLFLACGAVMHGFAGQLDMRKLSGLWGVHGFKIVTLAMLVGCLNLAGFPFTAGYFSKDLILAEAFYTPDGAIWGSSFAGWVLLITAGLTAYYTFRVFFRVFVGPTIFEPGDDHHGDDDGHGAGDAGGHGHDGFHPHGPRWAMNLVLVVLSIGSIAAMPLYFMGQHHGWAGDMVHASSADVGHLPWSSHDKKDAAVEAPVVVSDEEPDAVVAADADDGLNNGLGDDAHASHGAGLPAGLPAGLAAHADLKKGTLFGFDPHKVMYYVSAVFGFAGIGAAWFFHFAGRTKADVVRMDRVAASVAPVNRWAERKWYVDELYGFVFVNGLKMVGHLSHWFDKLVIDGFVDTMGRLPRWLAGAIRPTQNGVLHSYATRMIGGVAVVLLIVVLATL